MQADGTPIFITKQDESTDADKIGTAAKLFVPSAEMQENNATGVPLTLAGEVQPPTTDTANSLGLIGRELITGGAMSPDGSKVVLRTYSDAFEWDVANGDVVSAITTGTPRITPLPNETMGEAISYSADGSLFVTVSDIETTSSSGTPILSYTPVTTVETAAATEAATSGSDTSWLDTLTFQDLVYGVGAVGVLGLILVVVGVVGIKQSRQRRRTSGKGRGDAGPQASMAAEHEPEDGHEAENTGRVTGSAKAPSVATASAAAPLAIGGPNARQEHVYGSLRTVGLLGGVPGPTSGTSGRPTGGVPGKNRPGRSRPVKTHLAKSRPGRNRPGRNLPARHPPIGRCLDRTRETSHNVSNTVGELSMAEAHRGAIPGTTRLATMTMDTAHRGDVVSG